MAWLGSSKCLSSKDPKPNPPAKDVLRIYTMRFSPYSHRVKLVLHAKGEGHETINLDMVHKPQWFLDLSPSGKVPTIDYNGNVLHESTIIAEFLDATLPGRKLTTLDPLRRAKEQIAVNFFEETIIGFYGYIRANDETAKSENLSKMKTNAAKLIPFLEKGNPFICGEQPGLTDYIVWPFIERIWLFAKSVISDQPLLQHYFDRMGKVDTVIACRLQDDIMTEFYETYLKGIVLTDLGLE